MSLTLYCLGHAETLAGALLRPSPDLRPLRLRTDTPDDDFLDLDLMERGFDRVALVSHGLEGHSRRPYVLCMAQALLEAGWDVIAWNMRGCSGEPNALPRFYHSGETGDLHCVVQAALRRGYQTVALVGFSLGGNQILKYFGEDPDRVPSQVAAAACFSVPCDLDGAERRISRPDNVLYTTRFMLDLKKRVRSIARRFPGLVDLRQLPLVRTIRQFDHAYTAPLHGFTGAEDYYARCSSRQFLHAIGVPSLLVNALNDPFLSGSCFPTPEAKASNSFSLLTPRRGGHVGFGGLVPRSRTQAENTATDFLARICGG